MGNERILAVRNETDHSVTQTWYDLKCELTFEPVCLGECNHILDPIATYREPIHPLLNENQGYRQSAVSFSPTITVKGTWVAGR